MAENKTTVTDVDPMDFLAEVKPERKKQDAFALAAMMERISGSPAQMWGPSIVGFGQYHYRYESGREGDMPLIGFSPRKSALTLYILGGFDRYDELIADLGKFTLGKVCLYIKKLDDVDLSVLEEIVRGSMEHVRSTYETS